LYNVLKAQHAPVPKRKKLLFKMIHHLPNLHHGYVRMARLYEQNGISNRALQYYKKAINRQPSNTIALYYLGHLYAHKQQWSNAITTFQTLLDYQPEAWQARVDMAVFYFKRAQTHDKKLALYQLNYFMKEFSSPSPAQRAFLIGERLHQRAQYKHARIWLSKALQKQPDLLKAKLILALTFRALGQHQKALSLLKTIKTSKKQLHLEVQVQRIGALISLSQLQKARVLLQKVRSKFGKSPKNWVQLSQAFTQQAPKQAAAEEVPRLKRLIKEKPNNETLLFHLSYLYFKQYKMRSARRVLVQLLKNNPKSSEALNFLGYLYADSGIRLQKAEKLVRQALQIKPGNAYFLDSLGWVYYQQGKLEEAKRILELAKWHLPSDPTILVHLAITYQRQGKLLRALRLFRQVDMLELMPRVKRKVQTRIRQILRRLPKPRKASKRSALLSPNPRKSTHYPK